MHTAREIFEAFADSYDPERTYEVTLLRDGKTVQVRGRIPFRRRVEATARPDPQASPLAAAIREGIFGEEGSAGQ